MSGKKKKHKFGKKKNKYALSIDSELDLHGLYTEEAFETLRRFLDQSYRTGCHTVLIIVGKGLHSQYSGGVLGGRVRRYLFERGYRYRDAPPHYGGSGAIIVSLYDT